MYCPKSIDSAYYCNFNASCSILDPSGTSISITMYNVSVEIASNCMYTHICSYVAIVLYVINYTLK